jgi:hypothetical protein
MTLAGLLALAHNLTVISARKGNFFHFIAKIQETE